MRSTATSALGSLLALASLLTAPAAAAQTGAEGEAAESDEQAQAYRALIEDAVNQSRAGHLEEALALFRQAHAIRPSARTLRGIGLVRFGLSDYAGTVRALEASLEDERRPLSEDSRAEAQRVLDRARGFVARVDLQLSPEGAQISADGRALERREDGSILLNPGRHELRFESDGHVETRVLDVEGGSTRTLEVTLDAVTTREPERSRVRLTIRSNPTGLVLHALPMSGPDELVPGAVGALCAAPCEAPLEVGLYRLALGHPAETPVPLGDYRIEESLRVVMHREQRGDIRLAGWLAGAGSLVAGLVILASMAAVSSDGSAITLGIIAGSLGAAAVPVGLPLILWGDSEAVELLPAGDE